MSWDVVIGIGLVGGVGALARFGLDGAVSSVLGRDFPFGTLLVNVLGAFVLGLLAGLSVQGDRYRLLGTGLIGSFTTFSTWMLESHRLEEDGQPGFGAVNLLISLLAGLGVAWAGQRVGLAL
ncbi:MAG TPA: fluoride efflux transporter CrcB [Solirubrobacteraceae bacterium]|nr:fluoride efflux transporter CrcB [Solirubrobacteraceae bacterium]